MNILVKKTKEQTMTNEKRFLILPAIVGVALMTATPASAQSDGEAIAKGSDCFSCHAVDTKVVGPAFKDVAAKFAGDASAVNTLVDAIDKGHVGTWGSIPMPPHPSLSADQTKQIVTWILGLKSGSAASGGQAAPAASQQAYTYTIDGKKVTVGFPIFQDGSTTKVTKAVFHGFETYNSYCFRCHGEDAVGGSYAPNLRNSLSNGMTEQEFTSVAMVGRKEKGMPSWAGFFTPAQIQEIYAYVKARSVGAVGTGTPQE